MSDKHLYRFGDFELHPDQSILKRGDENISITPKMLSTLFVLVKNHGRIVDKDTLLKEVWPDSFVEEGNIAFNIRHLRKALGDDAQSPTYIETVPKRGYRFIADVEVMQDEDPGAAGEDAVARPGTKALRSFPLRYAASIAILGAAIGGAFLYFFLQDDPSEVPILSQPFESEKLSTDGRVFHAVITSDGKNLIYTHRDGGRQSLWLRQLETSNNVQIVPPSDHFYGGLAVSPDGTSVYFTRGTQQGPQIDIYKMPIFGGVPQKIVEQTQGWISISPQGDRISFVRCQYQDDDYCSLYMANTLDGGNEVKLVTRARPIRIGDNKISPDGKTIAFAVGQSRTSSNEFNLAGVDIETRTERELTPQKFFNINYIAWLPDRNSLLITAMQLPERHYRIRHVSVSTGEVSHLTSDSETYSRLSLDDKASLLVSTQVEPDFRLAVYPIDEPRTPPRVLTNALTVAYTPDGKLVYSSARTGDAEIWSVNADGTEQRQLTNDPSGDIAPLVAPDGTVFFESDRTGEIHVWRMNPDGSNQTQITRTDGGFPLRLAPGGRWLYYRSALNGTLRRVDVETGTEEMVLKDIGRNLVVSPDASKLAYSERQGPATILSIYSLTDSRVIKTFTIDRPTPYVSHLAWPDRGEYLAYVCADDRRENATVWIRMLDSDASRQIADLRGEELAELTAFAISPDGKSFAAVKGSWKHDVVLLRGLKPARPPD